MMTSCSLQCFWGTSLCRRHHLLRAFVRCSWMISIATILTVFLFIGELEARHINGAGSRQDTRGGSDIDHPGVVGGKVLADSKRGRRLHLSRGDGEYVNISWGLDTQLVTKDKKTSDPPVYDPPATQIQVPDVLDERRAADVTAWSTNGIPLVVDKIFWSEETERLLPTGSSDEDVLQFVHVSRSAAVSKIEPAMWNRCGRPKNQFITLEDGTKLCARYRHPQNALIQGEVLSFYLSRLLGLDSTPSVVLSRLDPQSPQWRGQDLSRTNWTEGTPVALIQWIDDLGHGRSHVKMPASILFAYEQGTVLNGTSLGTTTEAITASELVSIIQWTDLILFDYITGHYDRVASMQDGADRERKPSILHENIRNMRQVWQTGKLVLLDNESGLLDGYELIYRGRQTGQRFLAFHRRMLRTVCLFRRSTVAQIRWIAYQADPARTLLDYASARDPLFATLDLVPELEVFKTYFRVRLKEVVEWISDCERNTKNNMR